MTGLRSLLWREWREARGVILGCAVFALVASLLCQHFVFKWNAPEWTGTMLVPYTLALVALILASDLVSHDVITRRIEGLALLPVPLSRVLVAKLLFLTVVLVTFAGALIGLQYALLALFGVGDWFDALGAALAKARLLLGLVVLVTSAVLFFSCIAVRSFVAALLGAALTALVVGLGALLEVGELFLQQEQTVWKAGAVLVLFFVGTGAATVLRAPAHVASRKRLRVVGLAVLGAILLPVSGGAAWAVHEHFSFDPDDPGVSVYNALPSPDGQLVAVQMSQVIVAPTADAPRAVRGGQEGFVFEVATGRLVRRLGYRTSAQGWAADGSLAVFAINPLARLRGRNIAGWFIDPHTGERVRSTDAQSFHREIVEFDSARPDWLGLETRPKGAGWRARLVGGSHEQFVDASQAPVPMGKRGQVLAVSAEGVVNLHDLVTGQATPFHRVEDGQRLLYMTLSPSGRYVLVRESGRAVVLDAATGAVELSRDGESAREFGYWLPSLRRDDLLSTTRRSSGVPTGIGQIFNLTTGETYELGHRWGERGAQSAQGLMDGRLLVRHAGGVDVLGVDGRLERTLVTTNPEVE